MQDERKIRLKSGTHHFLRCSYQFTGHISALKGETNAKSSYDNQTILSAIKQLIALFLEDDTNIVFVLLRMKIKVALGGVIHPLSTKI